MSSTVTLESLFAQPARLPVVPEVVRRLMQHLDDDGVAVAEVAAQVESDPVISAKTLRLANSAYFRAPRTVSGIDAALRMLGFRMVRNLVLGCGAVGAFRDVPGMDLAGFWRYSLQTACGARWLAQQAGDDADLAFTVGLLHGIGHLVMHSEAPDAMRAFDMAVAPLAPGRAQAERERFGFDHGAVAAELARRWNFPAPIVDALARVPQAGEGEAGSGVAAWVHIAAWLARIPVLAWDAERIRAACPIQVGRAAGVELAWDDDAHALRIGRAGASDAMPDLAALSQGMEEMLAAR